MPHQTTADRSLAPVGTTPWVAACARHKPGGNIDTVLEAHPSPRKLHQTGPDYGVPGFADALFVLHSATAVWARREAREGSDTASIPKVAAQDLPR